jgi:hypothetical protein
MAIATPARYLDDLDLSRCIIGTDAVLDRSTNTLYEASHAGELSLIGTFDSPGEAMSALDLLAA